MATEQTFRSPGFFEQEIDISGLVQNPVGVPAGVIGAAQKGPAFVPVTVGSFADFQVKFGSLEPNMFGPYAVQTWLKNRQALTYMRVLGAGANETAADMSDTQLYGIVKNAGFVVSGTFPDTAGATTVDAKCPGARGAVQFIVAKHAVVGDEAQGYPIFTQNSSTPNQSTANLVRGMVFLTTGTRMMVLDFDKNYSDLGSTLFGNIAKVGSLPTAASQQKYFKLVLSSTAPTFGTSETKTAIRILTASLDPSDGAYIGTVLNTDPLRFETEQHLLYADFSVEHDLARPVGGTVAVGIVSGSLADSAGGTKYQDMFGRFDTRYQTARTTNFISQPYGRKEYDLFYFETIDDGSAGNGSYKVSIANLRASTDPSYKYGTFEVQIRAYNDTDVTPQILEAYPNCNLDPQSDRYVARIIGDAKVYFDFDQTIPSERKLMRSGKYANVSQRVRIRMSSDVENKAVPSDALPFGFRGVPALKTSDTLTDITDGYTAGLVSKTGVQLGDLTGRRLKLSIGSAATSNLTGSIVPPLPMTFKVTRGVTAATGFLGYPGIKESVDPRFYWGVKTTRILVSSATNPTSAFSDVNLRSNDGSEFNSLINAYSKFVGISGLDALVTGTAADEFNDNKFTLAKVATSQRTDNGGLVNVFNSSVFTGSAEQIMLESAYIRNGVPKSTDYTIDTTGLTKRYTLASLIATSSVLFNRFTPYAKFTNIFYGGFDGVNILDRDQFYFRDRAFSSDTGGKAGSTDPNVGLATSSGNPNQFGAGRRNNNVASVNSAISIMSNPSYTNINVLAIPGVRDTFVTDNALAAAKANGLMLYVMDMIKYDSSGNRLYDDSSAKPDPATIAEKFSSRGVDNNYGATFFPDVSITDSVNRQTVKVPSSVAVLGVLGYNDSVAYPWFAPAGFNRGALSFVANVETRLSQDDRDTLYDARINPIAVFPTGGFVVFGQKTLQQASSALDRINVRRLLLEVKRLVGNIAQGLLFEPNNAQTRSRFVASATPQLALIQSQQGIESFKVVCDESNNTASDVDSNRLNGRIIIVPTRAVEFISVDFIITNSGVQFA